MKKVTRAENSTSNAGTPTITQLPPQSRTSIALRSTRALPTHSKAQFTPPAPKGPVRFPSFSNGSRLRIALTLSVSVASMKSVAPNSRASGSFAATVSTAMMREAPAMRSPWMTLSPTPPTPNTAAVSPCCTRARFRAAPTPVSTPHPMRHADDRGTSSSMRTAWVSFTTVRSANTEVAAKFHAGSPLNVNGLSITPMV